MKRLILLSLVGLAAAVAARADIIYVQGDVSGTWEADTVMVTGEVRVPPGQTLVIEPGVKVLFQGWYKLIVDSAATLLAIGTEQDTILFDALQDTAHWHGIRFQNSSDLCQLMFCHITSGLATGSSYKDQSGGGIFSNNCNLEIQRCRIDNCLATEAGGGMSFLYGNPSIRKNSICLNSATTGGGIYLAGCDSANLQGNIIDSNVAYSGYGHGGGVLCSATEALIIGNIINNNETLGTPGYGGGIHCVNTSPPFGKAQILANVIYENFAERGGGISLISYDNSLIEENIVLRNHGSLVTGGMYLTGSGNTPIIHNYVIDNISDGGGGGMSISYNSTTVRHNTILGNSATHGGGILNSETRVWIVDNFIERNYVTEEGSAIYTVDIADSYLNDCTFALNFPYNLTGIKSHYFSDNILVSCAYWSNGAILPLSTTIAYSDIQNGWPGIGNISLDPAFVDTAHDDYRLLWGSPCIDAGHPDSLDPDGTRADMGAFYYDQSTPVRILLTPHEIPFLIPDSGGTMTYTLRLDTHLEEPQVAIFWCDVTLPDSSIFGPLLGPATVDVYPNQMVSWVRYQGVPGTAPLGVSHYNAYAVVGSDTSKDSFMFGVMGFGSDVQDPWENWGDPLGVPPAPLVRPGIPAKYALHPPHPNPFNAESVLSYQLPVASFVSLRVYDTAGRLVQTLVNGWMAAGFHKAVFDGAGLPSGIYICRLQAGNFEAVQKMVLLK